MDGGIGTETGGEEGKVVMKLTKDMILWFSLPCYYTQVKNKKRWSQVMYMWYILLLRCKEEGHPDLKDTYILTTDADVIFRYGSVKALMDLLDRDEEVGAVCARTHPKGSGPVVWYQVG